MLIRPSLITRPFGLFEQRSCFTNYRVPSRIVRYGIVYGSAAKDTLEEFEPQLDSRMKRQAEMMVEKLQAFIECCEAYEEATDDTPKEPEPKAKAKKRSKR